MSQAVIDEAAAGDATEAQKRLAVLATLGSGTVWWSRHSCLQAIPADRNVCSTKLCQHAPGRDELGVHCQIGNLCRGISATGLIRRNSTHFSATYPPKAYEPQLALLGHGNSVQCDMWLVVNLGMIGSLAMSMRGRKPISFIALAAFLVACAPPIVSLRAASVQQLEATPACCCCCSSKMSRADSTDRPCCCRANQPNDVDPRNPAATDEHSAPACPCPYCPATCSQSSLLKTLVCLAPAVFSPLMSPCLDKLGPETHPVVPAGPCDDVMHPPRA